MISYTVRVEWRDARDSAPRVHRLLEQLGSMAVGGRQLRLAGSSERPWSATTTVDASSPGDAVAAVVDRVESVTGIPPSGFAVSATRDHQRRAGPSSVPPLLVDHAEIADLLAVTPVQTADLVRRADFPPVVALARESGPLHDLDAVEAWAFRAVDLTGMPLARVLDGDRGLDPDW